MNCPNCGKDFTDYKKLVDQIIAKHAEKVVK